MRYKQVGRVRYDGRMKMDTEQIKQMATDVNNVAAASFQSGKEHAERPLLAKIARLKVVLAEVRKQRKDLLQILVKTIEYEDLQLMQETCCEGCKGCYWLTDSDCYKDCDITIEYLKEREENTE